MAQYEKHIHSEYEKYIMGEILRLTTLDCKAYLKQGDTFTLISVYITTPNVMSMSGCIDVLRHLNGLIPDNRIRPAQEIKIERKPLLDKRNVRVYRTKLSMFCVADNEPKPCKVSEPLLPGQPDPNTQPSPPLLPPGITPGQAIDEGIPY